MARYKIESVKYPGHRDAAQESDMAILLNRVGHKWPDEGIPARMLTAVGRHADARWEVPIAVWVKPKVSTTVWMGSRKKRTNMAHRVMCKCPGCGTEFSVGRLAQHVCRAGE